MKKMWNRVIAVMLVLCMALSMTAVAADSSAAQNPAGGVQNTAAASEENTGKVMMLKLNETQAYLNGSMIPTLVYGSGYVSKLIMVNGSTLLPLRFVCECLGFEVGYNEQTNNSTITDTANGVRFELVTGTTEMYKYDLEGNLLASGTATAPTTIIEGVTHVPVRSLLEAMGFYVYWDDEGYVLISENPKTAEEFRSLIDSWGQTGDDSEYPDTDNDGIPDVFETDLFHTDPNNPDTDSDGLPDGYEVYTLGTDPLKQDSDDNGVLDGAEDADDDGLTNSEEFTLGTDPLSSDTDEDGLTDSEEIDTYHTDPLNADSDEDNINDGDEISMGLNPLNPQTFGIPDSQYTFTQTISAEKLEEINADNLYCLGVDIQAAGNANSMLIVTESSYSNLSSGNDAILGKAVELSYNEKLKVDSITIKFTIPDDKISGTTGKYNDPGMEGIKRFQIFKYDKNSKTLCPVQTDFDTVNNMLFVTTQEFGDYMVLDLDKWMYNLGIVPEAEMPQANAAKSLRSNISALPKYNQQIDVVFAFDISDSMVYDTDPFKENAHKLISKLYDIGITANTTNIMFGHYQKEHFSLSTTYGSTWAKTPQEVTDMLKYLYASTRTREDHLDVLETIMKMPFKQNVPKFVFVITDEKITLEDNMCYVDRGRTIDNIADDLAQAGIITSFVSLSEYNYGPIYEKTGGEFIRLYNNIWGTAPYINDMYESIKRYFDEHTTYTYIGSDDLRVRTLNAPITKNGTMDTDRDWLTDWEETDQNALAFFAETPYNDGDIITDLPTFAQYIDYSSTYDPALFGRLSQCYSSALADIRVLPILSDPAAVDSDYDGINDCDDEYPLDNSFKGNLNYQRDGVSFSSNVEFNVDYRTLFSNNKSYSGKLAVMSSLLAADIYDDAYVSVTSGTSGGSNNPVDLAALFGLVGVEDISLSAGDYAVDKDDLTEFVIGHRLVEYNGIKKEIVVLVVRGTNGTNAEWSSNFDVGADTAEYYNAVGESHPDWKNKSNHKGFDVAANRVLDKVNDYFARHQMLAPKTILVTGHSRGAAIANILGAHFEDAFDFTSYTYTFAAPNTTTASVVSRYQTIFNIINSDDLIPYLPLESWGFNKYGNIRKISVKKCYESKWGSVREGTWEWLVGVDYNNDGGTARTLNAFSKIAKDRNEVYILDSSIEGNVWANDLGNPTREYAEAELARITNTFKDEKLLKFCNLSIVDGSLFMPYYVKITYSPAYLMQMLANMATGVGPMLGQNVTGKYEWAKISFALSSGRIKKGIIDLTKIGGLTDPHLPITYYLVVYNNFKNRI